MGSKRVKRPRAVLQNAPFSSSTVDATHHFSSTVDHRDAVLEYFWSTVDEKYPKSSTNRRRSTEIVIDPRGGLVDREADWWTERRIGGGVEADWAIGHQSASLLLQSAELGEADWWTARRIGGR